MVRQIQKNEDEEKAKYEDILGLTKKLQSEN